VRGWRFGEGQAIQEATLPGGPACSGGALTLAQKSQHRLSASSVSWLISPSAPRSHTTPNASHIPWARCRDRVRRRRRRDGQGFRANTTLAGALHRRARSCWATLPLVPAPPPRPPPPSPPHHDEVVADGRRGARPSQETLVRGNPPPNPRQPPPLGATHHDQIVADGRRGARRVGGDDARRPFSRKGRGARRRSQVREPSVSAPSGPRLAADA
jgi:hypothetical protein